MQMKQIIRGFVSLLIVFLFGNIIFDDIYAQNSKRKAKNGNQAQSKSSINKSRAGKYVSRGKARIKQKKYLDALNDFKRAHRLYPSKTTQNYIKRLSSIVQKQKSQSNKNENKVSVPINKKSIQSPYKLSQDFFKLSSELEKSTRKMKIASMGLKPINVKSPEEKRQARLNSINIKVVNRPEDRRAQRDLAIEYEKESKFLEAKNIYLSLIEQNPEEPDYHYFLGSLYSKMGNNNNAGFAFKEALELDPNHKPTIEALSRYGDDFLPTVLVNTLINNSINEEPNGSAQILSKSRAFFNSEDFSELIQLSLENEKVFSKSSSLSFMKAQSYEALGKIEDAKRVYKIATKIDKTDIRSAIALGDIYFSESNFVYSAMVFNSIIDQDPMNISLKNKIGLSFYNGFEWAKAATVWEDLLKISPQHTEVKKLLPEVYYILSLEYDRKGFSNLSRRAFSNALSVNSNSFVWLPNALKTAAKYYRENGFYKLAIKSYHDAMEIVPNDYDSYNGLGATYWYMGEKQMAISSWQSSLELNSKQNAAKGWLLLANKSSN